MTTAARTEQGQIAVFALGLALVAFAVAGLAVDGTRAFLMRRTLQNAADSAALAGASELDATAYYHSRGERVVLDPRAAERVSASWFAAREVAARATVAAEENAVRVALRAEVPTTFLRLIGIGAVPVAVEASAEPFPGRP